MTDRITGPTRAPWMDSAGRRADDWRISGMVGHTFGHLVDCALASQIVAPVWSPIPQLER
jgi:hypothetical protein